MPGFFEEINSIRDPSFFEAGGAEVDAVRRITPVTVQEISLFQATRQSLSRQPVFLTPLVRYGKPLQEALARA